MMIIIQRIFRLSKSLNTSPIPTHSFMYLYLLVSNGPVQTDGENDAQNLQENKSSQYPTSCDNVNTF